MVHCREINELVNEPASQDVTPVVGMVTFDEDIVNQMFTISSLSDNETEFNEQFNVRLTYVSGGGLLSETTNQTLLTGTIFTLFAVCSFIVCYIV